LERRLTLALSNLIVDDWRLLTTWAPSAGAGAERAIAAALGWHIKAVMERSWDVDCEYNRSGAADDAAVKRWLATSDEGVMDGQPPPTPVTPDLIVHRRGLRGKANNLFILELKKNDDGDDSYADQTSRGSLKSILDIQKNFDYQHAVLLNLQLTPRDRPRSGLGSNSRTGRRRSLTSPTRCTRPRRSGPCTGAADWRRNAATLTPDCSSFGRRDAPGRLCAVTGHEGVRTN
jgi:hypothetical protein